MSRTFLLLLHLAAAALPIHAQTYRWENVAIVAGGFITGITFHPSEKGLLYTRTDIGGAYRRDPGAKRWVPLTDWVSPDESNLLGVEAIGLDPTDPNRLYLALGTYTQSWAGNGAIVRSTDRGATFHRTNLPIKLGANEDGRFAGERLVVDPSNPARLFFGSRNDGLWTSTDYGATWARTNFPATGANGVGVVAIAFDGSTVFVAVSQLSNGLWQSADAGANWAPVAGQPSGLLPNRITRASDGRLYVTYGDQPGPNGMTRGAVWRYSPRDSVWTNITPPSGVNINGWGFGAVAVSATDPNLVIVSTMDRWGPIDDLFRSRDGGATWESVSSRSVMDHSLSPWLTFGAATVKFGWWMGALAIDPFDAGHVLFGTGATIWESGDVGNVDAASAVHWRVGALGIEETAVLQLASPPEGRHLISALGDIGVLVHDDLFVSPRPGMAVNPVFGTATGLDFAGLRPLTVVRTGSSSTRRGAISTDGGSTWKPFEADAPGAAGNSGTIAISADAAALLWSTNGSSPYLSRDGGRTWSPVQGVPNLAVTADRVNPLKFYAFNSSNGAVFASTDGGANFASAALGLPRNAGVIRAVPGREGDLWLAQSGGLYHSTDSGASFTRLANIQSAAAVGFGKAETDGGYPALYLAGRPVGGVNGIHRSLDGGATWLRINDDAHQYGWVGTITGDPRVFGRVYIGTNGRGVVMGNPLPAAGTPVPRIDAVVNGASFLPGFAPESWVTVRGENLAGTTRIWTAADIQNGVLPLELDGARVAINDEWAPVYYISPTQLNVLAPSSSAEGPVNVRVRSGVSESSAFTAEQRPFSPALFVFDPQDRRYAAAVAADGAYIGPAGLFGAALATRPARPQETVQFFGTGCGASTSATAEIGGIVAAVQYAGTVSPGLCQFNLVIPALSDGDHPVRVTVGGVTSPAGVFVSVKQP